MSVSLDTFDIVERWAKFRYTFSRAGRHPVTNIAETQSKSITLYARAWTDHEAQARAHLPWGWFEAPVTDMQVLRI